MLYALVNVTKNLRKFLARAVQLANWGALTRIILSGVLLSKFWCWASTHHKLYKGRWRENAHQHWAVPFLSERNSPAYARCVSICLNRLLESSTWVHFGHPQYSEGRTSERRALVDRILLSVMDNRTVGTVFPLLTSMPFPSGSWQALIFPAASHFIRSEGVRRDPTHTPLLFQPAHWGEPNVFHAIKGVSDPWASS